MGTIATLFCTLGPRDVVGQAAELTETDFEQGSIMLGRSLHLAIPIPDEEVSRIHCSLSYKDGNFILTDQDSTNGTLVNGERIEAFKPFKLRHEDEIQLGHTYFVFSLALPESSREPEHELARQLFQRFGWKVIQPKGARHWLVPDPQNLSEIDAASRQTIQHAFSSSAAIGLNLEAHAGKRALLEKYQVGRAGQNEHEAYVLFLNGRIIGAYAVDPQAVTRLLPLSRYELSVAS